MKKASIINISNKVRRALAKSPGWFPVLFRAVADNIERKGVSVSFWKNEEEWATLLDAGDIVGYLWSKAPLVIVREGSIAEVSESSASLSGFEVIKVSDCAEQNLCVDDELLSLINSGAIELNPQGFTAEEWWFATNS